MGASTCSTGTTASTARRTAPATRPASDNVFSRESAQRLLTEQLRRERTGPLRNAIQARVHDTSLPRIARLHALWALIGGGPLDRAFHERLLADSDATFRAWAVRAAGNDRG